MLKTSGFLGSWMFHPWCFVHPDTRWSTVVSFSGHRLASQMTIACEFPLVGYCYHQYPEVRWKSRNDLKWRFPKSWGHHGGTLGPVIRPFILVVSKQPWWRLGIPHDLRNHDPMPSKIPSKSDQGLTTFAQRLQDQDHEVCSRHIDLRLTCHTKSIRRRSPSN